MEAVNLCKCLNCDTLLVDENPQTGAISVDIKSNEGLGYMIRKVDETDPFGYWACPKCETDSYLVDYPENK